MYLNIRSVGLLETVCARNSVEAYHDLLDLRWVFTPGTECSRRITKRHNRADRLLDRKATFLKHAGHIQKIFRQRVSRSQNVEVLFDGSAERLR